jgi:hypothetical protein
VLFVSENWSNAHRENPYSLKAVKVDDEYQNLSNMHSAIGFRQKKSVSDSAFAEQVLDRYGSAIFTSGKFTFGQSVYDKVLANHSTLMSFKEYGMFRMDLYT